MKKEFLPYEQALELKELGFREDTSAYYFTWDDERSLRFAQDSGNEIDWNEPPMGMDTQTDYVSAPLYQQAFRWFRENCEVYSEILSNVCGTEETYFTFNIMTANVPFQLMSENNTFFSSDIFNTYEEAELDCIIKLIEIVKNK